MNSPWDSSTSRAATRRGRTPATLGNGPYLQKIEALLADMELPWSYAEAIAENITGGKKPTAIKRLQWVRDWQHLRGIVAALHARRRKASGRAVGGSRRARLATCWASSRVGPGSGESDGAPGTTMAVVRLPGDDAPYRLCPRRPLAKGGLTWRCRQPSRRSFASSATDRRWNWYALSAARNCVYRSRKRRTPGRRSSR